MQNVRTSILLLTARDASEDIVKGLDAGAEHYLTKPFDFEALLARIRARTRSGSGKNTGKTRFADLARPRTFAMLMTEDGARRVTNFGQLPKKGIAPVDQESQRTSQHRGDS